MKTALDIAKIVNHHCYDSGEICERLWCVCCTMCSIAETMILEGTY